MLANSDFLLPDPLPPQEHEERYGFVIYRTNYTSDAKWVTFMAFLYAQVHARHPDEWHE
jgi:hypothetical protein